MIAALVVGALGLTLVLSGARRRSDGYASGALAELLDLPGTPVVDVASLEAGHLSRLLELWRDDRNDDTPSVGVVERLRRLARRPGDVATAAVVAAGLLLVGVVMFDSVVPGIVLVAGVALSTSMVGRRRRKQRQQKIEAQFPEALSVIASSLQAGNPLRRSLQILAERGAEPLASEIYLVVAETELGAPLADAVDRMAERVENDDVRWFARALRIQQAAGGQLAPLVRTIASVMTARAELQREARALTAEGRVSAWVLGALPVILILACQIMNPDYLAPLFQGWGWAVLAGCAASVGLGIAWILRMVDQGVTA